MSMIKLFLFELVLAPTIPAHKDVKSLAVFPPHPSAGEGDAFGQPLTGSFLLLSEPPSPTDSLHKAKSPAALSHLQPVYMKMGALSRESRREC